MAGEDAPPLYLFHAWSILPIHCCSFWYCVLLGPWQAVITLCSCGTTRRKKNWLAENFFFPFATMDGHGSSFGWWDYTLSKKKNDGITRASTVYHIIFHVLILRWGKKTLKDGHLICSYGLMKTHSKKQDETLQCTEKQWQLCLINNHHGSSDSDDFTFSCTF